MVRPLAVRFLGPDTGVGATGLPPPWLVLALGEDQTKSPSLLAETNRQQNFLHWSTTGGLDFSLYRSRKGF
jgi:hypothetical protein